MSSKTNIVSELSESDLIEIVECEEYNEIAKFVEFIDGDKKPGPRRADALKELSSRRTRKRLSGRGQKALKELAEKHACNTKKSAMELRKAATVALGKMASSTQQTALLKLLRSRRSRDPSTVRLAAISLGRTGDKSALEALEKIEIKFDRRKKYSKSEISEANRAVKFAKNLLSYRHGLGTHRLRATKPKGCLKVGSPKTKKAKKHHRPFDRVRIKREKLDEELKSVSGELRAIIPIYRERAWTFECGIDNHLLIFNGDFVKKKFITGLRSKNAVVAIILDRHCDGRFVSEYFLSNPARSGTGSIVGVRPMGTKVHAGDFTLHLEKLQIEFSLRTVMGLSKRAIDFKGIFDLREKEIELTKEIVLEAPAFKQERPRVLKPEY